MPRHGPAVAGLLAITTVMALASASCADPGDVIAPSAARRMSVQLDQVRAAVDAADARAARQALRALERDAVRLRDEGLIDPARADVILASAREVAVQLSLLPGSTTLPSPTLSPSLDPESSEDDDGYEGEEKVNGKDKGNGKGNGKGKGNGNGNGQGHDD
jgi:hypothetical protein